MTVLELRKALESLPEDMDVYCYHWLDGKMNVLSEAYRTTAPHKTPHEIVFLS